MRNVGAYPSSTRPGRACGIDTVVFARVSRKLGSQMDSWRSASAKSCSMLLKSLFSLFSQMTYRPLYSTANENNENVHSFSRASGGGRSGLSTLVRGGSGNGRNSPAARAICSNSAAGTPRVSLAIASMSTRPPIGAVACRCCSCHVQREAIRHFFTGAHWLSVFPGTDMAHRHG